MAMAEQKHKWSQSKKARIDAAHRQRRVIFNDDTYELAREDANTPEGFLRRRLKPLVGTHVDSIAWSVLGGWADAPVYDSKLQPIYGDAHGGPPVYWPAVTRNVHALIDSGNCPLQLVIDLAHDNGMEMLASIRMNDCHDSFIPGGITTWKREHPELLVDSTGRLPQMRLYVIAQDFTHQAVRDRKFQIIEEIAQRYDVDGFELDFVRHPVFFSRTMRGQAVTAQQLETMTSLMRRIRHETETAAQRRGRPMLIAMRVLDSFDISRRMGLDLATWLQEDLVDIVIAGGGYAPFTLPVSEFIQRCHPYDVPVYPCIRGSGEYALALASNWHHAGADGVYFWNLGTAFEYKQGDELVQIRKQRYAMLQSIGEASTRARQNKLFCVDGANSDNYLHMSSPTPLPVRSKQVYPGPFMRIPIVVGDDIEAAVTDGTLAGATLALKLRGPDRTESLRFDFNGQRLEHHRFTMLDEQNHEYELSYTVSPNIIKQGRNYLVGSIEGFFEAMKVGPVEVYDLNLSLTYHTDRIPAG